MIMMPSKNILDRGWAKAYPKKMKPMTTPISRKFKKKKAIPTSTCMMA
jgi:hypothetical protein